MVTRKPDVLQKKFWQYRRFWFFVILILILGRFLLPSFHVFKGWEQKFLLASLEIGKSDPPSNAVQARTLTEALSHVSVGQRPSELDIELSPAAVLLASWQCKAASLDGICFRYLYNGQPLTMVASELKSSKKNNQAGAPFTRTGWGGYSMVKNHWIIVLVAPIEPSDLQGLWPAASAPVR